MELEHSFTIPVAPEQAWEALLDVERVAPCMPGASVDSVDGEVITGRIKVKVGPVTLTYAGSARFSERDAEARSVTLEASGRETRGAGTASATVHSVLRGQGDQTEVVVHTTLAVTGRPAQFGRGMLAEVGGRIIGKFAANLAAELASGPAAGVSAGTGAGAGAAAPAPAPAAAPPSGAAGPGGTPGPAAAAPAGAAPIDDLSLPARAVASLRQAGITTVAELAARDEGTLLTLAGVGPQTIRQIRGKLAGRGLDLAPQPAQPPTGQPAAAPGPAAAAPEQAAPVTGPPPEAQAAPRGARPPDEEAIDLLNVAGLPVLKRILPVVGGAAMLLAAVMLLLLRRRRARRRSRRRVRRGS